MGPGRQPGAGAGAEDVDEGQAQAGGVSVGAQPPGGGGQARGDVVQQAQDAVVGRGAQAAGHAHEVDVRGEVAQVQGGLGGGGGVQVDQGQFAPVPQELAVVQVPVGRDRGAGVLAQGGARLLILLY